MSITSKVFATIVAVAAYICPQQTAATELVNLFVCNFDTEEDFNRFTIINVHDDATWTYSSSGYAQIMYNSTYPKDDWLVTEALDLKAGVNYTLKFNMYGAAFMGRNETFEIGMGTAPTAESLSQTILKENGVVKYTSYNADNAEAIPFTVDADGKYNIGFHATTPAGEWTLKLDDVAVLGPASVAEPEAPAQAVAFKVTPAEDKSLKATIECTLPDLTIKGNPLTAIEKAEIFRGETMIKQYIEPSPGAGLLYLDPEPQRGENTYMVRITANGGLTSEVSTTVFVGKEFVTRPAAVSDFMVVPALNGVLAAQIQFKTPSKAADGTELKELDRIDITRNGTVVHSVTEGFGLTGTTLAWLDTESEAGEVVYGAVAVNEGGTSDEVTETILMGIQRHEVPYSETFDRIASLSQFSIIDANIDGKTWDYSTSKQSAGCNPDGSNPKDDWIITPPIALKKNFLYRFSYKVAAQSMIYPERFETFMGTGASVEGMTQRLQENTDVKSSTMQEYSHEINANADGDYYFGIHATSDPDAWYLLLDDIKVEILGTDKAPGAVENITVVPSADGALKAQVSFKAPSVTVAGNPLEGTLSVEILVNGEKVKTIEQVASGADVSEEIEVDASGVATVTIKPQNIEGYGLSTKIETFIGIDVPNEPENVVAVENTDGTVTVKWTAPKGGVNGGLFADGMVKYDLYEGYTQSLVAENIEGTSYTYTPVMPDGMTQTFAGYVVVATTSAGSSEAKNAVTGTLAVGEAYPLPYKESFTNGGVDHITWATVAVNGRNAKWRLLNEGIDPVVESHDGDGGLMSFFPFTPADKALTYGGKVDVSKASKPVLSFYYYHIDSPSATFVLDVQVSKGNEEFATVKTIKMDAPENAGNSGWRRVLIPLDAYKEAGAIRYQLVAEAQNAEWRLHVDEITVFDAAGTAVPDVVIAAPTTVTVGQPAEAIVKVFNYGDDAAACGMVVTGLRSGDVALAVPALKHGESHEAKVDITPTVTSDDTMTLLVADENGTEISAPVEIEVVKPLYPTPENLAAEVANNVAQLTWDAPASSVVAPQPITDDIESYEPLIIDNIGDWTMHDIDGELGTYGISNNIDQGIVEYENAEAAMAFQVFNPSVAGVALFMTDASRTTWTPCSGSQYLAAFSDKDDKNDDWLISPELNGCEQEISFYVSSITSQYNLEKFRVLYSKSGKAISDFTEVNTSLSDANGDNYAPVGWTRVTATLPAGSRYFAINNVSEDSFCFLVDDITYIPVTSQERQLQLLGYNIYVGTEKVNDTPVTDTQYTLPIDESFGDDTKCSVSAVYDCGESAESNRVTVSHSLGLTSIDTESSVKVYGGVGQIYVKDVVETAEVVVYGADGRVIASSVVKSSDAIIPVASGIYIVKAGTTIAKVIVR